MATNIAGHDDDGVLEIYHASFIVCQPSIIQHLQENVPDIRMCFLDFIQQHNTVWFSPDRLCQLTALIISDIAWRSTHQPGYGMFFLVLTHVYAGHHALIIKQVFRKGFGKFCFTHARCTQKDE